MDCSKLDCHHEPDQLRTRNDQSNCQSQYLGWHLLCAVDLVRANHPSNTTALRPQRLYRTTPKNVLSVLLLVLGLASVMAQFGFDIVSLVAGLGIAGLAVGFAAQSTLANFIAGITILLEQSFQVGDWVHINENEGRVVVIALRTTHVLTRDNITVIIPNSKVASSEVTNITSKNFIRFDIHVRIAFEDDIPTARQEILQVLSDTDVVLSRPESSATVDEIGEYGVFFIVRFWVKPASVARMPVIKEGITENIKLAFDAAGISTPYPHMRLLMPKDVDYPIATKPFATTTQRVPSEVALTKEK